ncbi:MAG: major capsid protein [Deltaproteobacteria bacterium]|nr:major capsid protein [Deltaproteobacteria bacterium]
MPIGPYGAAGKLADYTQEINVIPNTWGRLNELGLFSSQPVSQRTVIIDQVDNVLTILPEKPVGSPATVANNEVISQQAFVIPHIPHNDALLASDIQGRRAPGDTGPTIIEVQRSKKLELLRRKHALTLEFLRIGALKGLIIGGSGNTIYDLYDVFNVTQLSINCALGVAGTDVKGKLLQGKRHIDDNTFNGGISTGYHCLCSASFFDALTSHPKVAAAYQYYTSTQEVLRNDVRTNFDYVGITFEEYRANGSVDGTSTQFIPNDAAYLFPTGVDDLFVNYYAPANHLDYVNTLGQELYSWEYKALDGKSLQFVSESNPLPLCRRPQAIVELTVS